MPQVPRYNQGGVQQAGIQIGRVQTQAPEGAFGGFEARAVSSAANEATEIVKKYQNDADQIALMEADKKATELEIKLMYDPKSGAMNQKGKNSFTLQDTVPAEYNKGLEEIKSNLNDRQKQAFDKLAVERGLKINRQLNMHVSGELKSYDDEETKSYLKTQQDAAILYANDPERVRDIIDRSKVAYASYAQRNGASGVAVNERLNAIESSAHASVIEKLIADDNDLQAKSYYESIKDKIVGKEAVEVAKAVEASSLRGESQRTADSIWSKGMTLSQSYDEANKIEDPKLRDSVVERIGHLNQQKRIAERDQMEDLSRTAYNILDKTPDVTKIPFWSKLDGSTRSALKNYAESKLSRKNVATDPDTYYSLYTLASTPDTRDKFAQTNLLSYVDKLSQSDFQELTKLQAAARKGEGKKELDGFMSDLQTVDSVLKDAGIDKNDSDYNKARWSIQTELSNYEQRTGKKATSKEVYEIAKEQTVKGITEKGFLWDTKIRKFELKPGQKFVIDDVEDIPQNQKVYIESKLKQKNMPTSNDAILKYYNLYLAKGMK